MKTILLIPHIKVLNANALSSPYTIGFPAMTAWLGAVHALERKVRQHEDFTDVKFNSTAVVCHDIDLQTYKGQGDYVSSIVATGNPLDKNGNRPSFIEEARAHLTVSLVIELKNLDIDEKQEFMARIALLLHSGMKMAAGDILDFGTLWLKKIDEDEENSKEYKKLISRLMPGRCLIERRDLMVKAMETGSDAMTALIDYLKVTSKSEQDDKGNVKWISSRKTQGWIVPIATGFHGLTELGLAQNQRDSATPHRFAESVVTLGEFVMPYRIRILDNMLWHYDHEPENNLYLCKQNKPITENMETE